MLKAQSPSPVLEDTRSSDVIILVMGCSRAGKSTFINHLLKHVNDPRPPLEVKPDVLETVTSELEAVAFDDQIGKLRLRFSHLRDEQRIILVDTPGIPDFGEKEQHAVLHHIAGRLREPLKKATLGGVIYVHDISQDRDDGARARRSIAALSGMLPEATLDKVILLTTKWRLQSSIRDFSKSEKELKEGQWGGVIRKAHLMRLQPDDEQGGPSAAWEVIRRTLWRLDIHLGKQGLKDVEGLRAELEKNGKTVPEEAFALGEALQGSLILQKEVLELMQKAAEGDDEAEESIRDKGEKLQTLHRAMVLNKSLFYAGLVPSLKRKLFAFNALVIQ